MKWMKRMLQWLKPTSLKNRLFMAFLLLIILPLSALQIRNHIQTKNLYEHKISEQNQFQIDQVKQAFEKIKSEMLMTAFQLEKERAVIEALQEKKVISLSKVWGPQTLVNQNEVVGIFLRIKSHLLLGGEQLNYTLSDFRGHLYVSYEDYSSMTYDGFMNSSTVTEFLEGGEQYIWVTPSSPNGSTEHTPEITLYTLLMDSAGKHVGVLRVSFDYQQWLKKNLNQFVIQNDYYLLDENGQVLYRNNPSGVIPSGIRQIVAQQQSTEQSYVVDQATSTIINISRIPSLNWYILSQFPLEVFFGDIRSINRQFFLTFGIFTLIFIIFTFFLLSAITRPLMLLKRSMSQIIEKNFRTFIPTDRYKGEILEIADSFNNMARDLNTMIDRLKAEERQKEAIRFQMLLQQMNPHFLLNTLNTLKWNVLSKGDQASADICLSLGRLLETSLNSEVDLIHLSDELGLADAYATIQNFRYDHRFEVRYEFEDRLKYTLVPKLSLQPLVENAIQHGLANMKTGGIITIRIYESSGNRLILEVEDNGCGLSNSPRDPNHTRKPIGIKNLKERLQLLFRDEAGLELIGSEQGTLARMHIPLLISPPFQEGGSDHVENRIR